jgi:hypothetical protein
MDTGRVGSMQAAENLLRWTEHVILATVMKRNDIWLGKQNERR